jgi:sodium/proline symporter
MDSSALIWVIVSFILYLLMMIFIGAFYAKKNSSTEDYFLGGRKLSGVVAALSAQASDMSGWLLMGLPGSVYALGTGQAWIAIGLFLGTIFNWLCISGRLRRYTIRANNAMTLPTYFENRFHDKKRILLFISSVTIVVFFLVYTASGFAAGGKLFTSIFNIDYKVALTVGAVVILAYTFLGGFMAVCVTDFVQGTLMLIALLAVPIAAMGMIGGYDSILTALENSGVSGGTETYLSFFSNGGKSYKTIDIISGLAWGLGYCGMPHILVRFMAVRNEKELNKSKGVAIVWVLISLVMSIIIGIVGRAYLSPLLTGGDTENVFIEMIITVFTKDAHIPLIGGIFLCGILAAIMSTADSQLLVTASSVAEDIFKGILKRDAKDETVFRVSKITVAAVTVVAYIIALNPNNSIMGLVSNAWAGLGAAFGPTVLLSLYWKRSNLHGAVAGILSGALTVVIWDYIPLLQGTTLAAQTGIYSLAVGFFISLVLIVVVSLLTPAPTWEMEEEFDDVSRRRIDFDIYD